MVSGLRLECTVYIAHLPPVIRGRAPPTRCVPWLMLLGLLLLFQWVIPLLIPSRSKAVPVDPFRASPASAIMLPRLAGQSVLILLSRFGFLLRSKLNLCSISLRLGAWLGQHPLQASLTRGTLGLMMPSLPVLSHNLAQFPPRLGMLDFAGLRIFLKAIGSHQAPPKSAHGMMVQSVVRIPGTLGPQGLSWHVWLSMLGFARVRSIVALSQLPPLSVGQPRSHVRLRMPVKSLGMPLSVFNVVAVPGRHKTLPPDWPWDSLLPLVLRNLTLLPLTCMREQF